VPDHHISSGLLMGWVGSITAVSHLAYLAERDVWMRRKAHLGNSALQQVMRLLSGSSLKGSLLRDLIHRLQRWQRGANENSVGFQAKIGSTTEIQAKIQGSSW